MCVCVRVCVQAGSDSKMMKRSFSTIGDQCVNGLWQEEHSLLRLNPDNTYRPRQKNYRGQSQDRKSGV